MWGRVSASEVYRQVLDLKARVEDLRNIMLERMVSVDSYKANHRALEERVAEISADVEKIQLSRLSEVAFRRNALIAIGGAFLSSPIAAAIISVILRH